MSPTKAALYLVGGLLGLVVLSAVISAIFAAIALIWVTARLLVMALIIGGLGYLGYKLYSLLVGFLPSGNDGSNSADMNRTSHSRSDSAVRSRSSSNPDEGVMATGRTESSSLETLKERYGRGELTEQEFERRLERQLDETG